MIGIAIFYFFHTSSGLRKVSLYLSQQVSQEIGQAVTLDIKEISLSPSQMKARIMMNDALEIELSGFMSPLDEIYDISYHIVGEKIVFNVIHFKDNVDIKGTLKGTKENFKLKGEGLALEGKVLFSLDHQPKKEKDVVLQMQKVSSAKLVKLFGEEALLAGVCSIDVDIPLYSEFEKEGDIILDIPRSGVYLKNIAQVYGIQLPDDFMLSAHSKLHLADATHTFDAKIETNVANIIFKRGKISDVNKKVTALYHLEVEELSKLRFFTKKRYGGTFMAEGELEYLDGLRFDGRSKSLGGEMDYYYAKGTLEAKLKLLSLAKVFTTMYYPTIMIGDISGKAEVDIEKNIAVVNLRSHNLRFKKSSVIETIYKATSVDIAKEIFTKTYFTSTIENGVVFYDFKADNRVSHIYLLDAQMDSSQNTIDTNFDIKMQGEELSGQVYGSLKSPQVKLDMSKYLEFKAKKEIDEFFGVGTSQRVKKELDDVDMDDVKGFIKGFF